MIKKDKDIVKEIEQQIYPATDEEYKNIADELENMSYTKTPSGILKKPCTNLNKEYLFLYLAKEYSRIWKEWDYVKILTDFLEENKSILNLLIKILEKDTENLTKNEVVDLIIKLFNECFTEIDLTDLQGSNKKVEVKKNNLIDEIYKWLSNNGYTYSYKTNSAPNQIIYEEDRFIFYRKILDGCSRKIKEFCNALNTYETEFESFFIGELNDFILNNACILSDDFFKRHPEYTREMSMKEIGIQTWEEHDFCFNIVSVAEAGIFERSINDFVNFGGVYKYGNGRFI